VATPVERRYHLNGVDAYPALTREQWLQRVLTDKWFKVQPPDWWYRAQEKEGRSIRTSASIWYKNYKPERKYLIWDQAPDEDFQARGYLW